MFVCGFDFEGGLDFSTMPPAFLKLIGYARLLWALDWVELVEDAYGKLL